VKTIGGEGKAERAREKSPPEGENSLKKAKTTHCKRGETLGEKGRKETSFRACWGKSTK